MRRIAVVGPSGSGKTALGRWLAATLALPFTDLDDLHRRPGWVEPPRDELRGEVDRRTRAACWVVAGNDDRVRDLIWPRADTLVWLDLPLPLALWRTTLRVFRQTRTGEPICNGNRQHFCSLVYGTVPMLGYTLRTTPQQRRAWPRLLAAPAHANLNVVRLRSASQVAAWQRRVQAGKTPVDR